MVAVKYAPSNQFGGDSEIQESTYNMAVRVKCLASMDEDIKAEKSITNKDHFTASRVDDEDFDELKEDWDIALGKPKSSNKRENVTMDLIQKRLALEIQKIARKYTQKNHGLLYYVIP